MLSFKFSAMIKTSLLFLSMATCSFTCLADDFWTSSAWDGDKSIGERYIPLTWEPNEIWFGSHFFEGNKGAWSRIGKTWVHPGQNAPIVRVFTSPREGTAYIRGTVRKLHTSGDGIRAEISVNDDPVTWKADIAGNDAQGTSHDIRIALKVGDRVYFRVSSGPTIVADTTGWNPSIMFREDDADFTAAEGFVAAKGDPQNPANCWSYYRENTNAPKAGSVMQAELDLLRATLKKAVSEGYEMPTDANLWRLVLEEWKCDDAPSRKFLKNSANPKDSEPLLVVRAEFLKKLEKHLKGMRQLYEKLADTADKAEMAKIGTKLAELEKRFATLNAESVWVTDILPIYFETRVWKRALVLANPLVKESGKLLFVKRRPTSYNHIVMQYFGWRAQRGGGLYVLDEPGKTLKCQDILAGQMEGGNIADPCLSWDGKKIVFSWVKLKEDGKRFPWQEAWTPKVVNEKEESHHEYYHIYEVNADGTGLRQLTDGCYEDLMPCYLPEGNIVFVSSRRKGHPRCFWWGFGERWTNYTTHKMNADGSGIYALSWHETNEWYPTVSHDGQVFYSRWDYIDRDAVTHQNLWSMRPDGTNPTAVWGNASLDIFSTFQAKPIPGSRKWVLTASAHHSCTGGSLVILDPAVAKDGPVAIERITPEIPFPEAETNDIPQFYASPWPLSEDFYLTAYSPYRLEFEPKPCRDEALGLYVYDRFGNRELLYRDREIGCDSPMPFAARKMPPVLPSFLPENAPNEGRFFVQDIYQGLGDKVERGSIKALRIVQIFPKTTLDQFDPIMGVAGEENGRAILGTVPVEADGSVNFIAPAQTPILFQALNEKGEAFQIMRSLTYLQPGEEIACIGCHEDRNSVVDGKSPYFNPSAVGGAAGMAGRPTLPIAAGREPSRIVPGKLEGRPFSFMESVQPILDAKCISCHGGDPENEVYKKNPINLTRTKNEASKWFSESYVALTKRPGMIPHWPKRNRIEVTPPGGENGSIGSGLKKVLADENHRNIGLTDEDWATIAAWIDQNAIFYGTTEHEYLDKQFRGEPIPMQELR